MATSAPKANLKAAPKAAAKEDAPASPKSKKKLFLIIGAAVLVAGGAAGGGWYYTHQGDSHRAGKVDAAKVPIYITLEPFTVNLQPENGDQYLQIAMTLLVHEQSQVELIKLQMPQVRNRLLMVLSSKKASEISSVEGKNKLSADIVTQANLPFAPQTPPQHVSGVYFTSFIIQ
jgi:flagellar FliL protein